MGGANTKGDRRERELVNRLDGAGFAVMRAPSSGSATDRNLPDVLAGNGDVFYAIEAKSSSGDPIYLDGEEVEALVYFARNFGAKPRVGVRFDREDWYFFHPGDLHVTDGGNYRIKLETALASGVDIDEIAGRSRRTNLDQYEDGGGDASSGGGDVSSDAGGESHGPGGASNDPGDRSGDPGDRSGDPGGGGGPDEEVPRGNGDGGRT